jgi:gamma-glutamyltranspeptidase/glutathione hydrolase
MKKQFSIFILLISLASPSYADGPPAAAVASAHPLATEAGLQILNQGGNAFDAAVAVTAALAVVEPAASGLGGGGFWLLHRESDGMQVMLDGREKAPEFAHSRMYLDEQGDVRERASLDGPLAGGIPGIPAGIVYLSMNFGRLPLAVTLAPAIAYAENGFELGPDLQNGIRGKQELLKSYPSSAAVFLVDGEVPGVGQLIIQNDLANTLRVLANKGFAGFYQGEIARKMVHGVQQAGGIWTLKDLENYVVLERAPIVTQYHDVKIISASPPSSGGIVMGQALKMLEHFDLEDMDRVTRAHHIIEAMRRAYRDRALFLGDPDFYDVPTERLLNEDYNEDQAGESTTHFSILDMEGNRVAGTLSINRFLGSGFLIPEVGILVNNEMDDFAVKPNDPNSYGLIGFEANAIEASKRPLSSMSPSFVESQDRIGILGTPGGSRIISMVLLGVLDYADNQLPESWVDLPRYHHQYRPDIVFFERNAFTEDEQRRLAAMGHTLRVSRRNYGNMHAIMWDRRTNHVYAASDKRGEGEARLMKGQK